MNLHLSDWEWLRVVTSLLFIWRGIQDLRDRSGTAWKTEDERKNFRKFSGGSFPVSSMPARCPCCRERKRLRMIFCIRLPDSATATIPARLLHLKMFLLPWRKSCSTRRLPAGCFWPLRRKELLRWKQNCSQPVSRPGSWARSCPKRNRKSAQDRPQ